MVKNFSRVVAQTYAHTYAGVASWHCSPPSGVKSGQAGLCFKPGGTPDAPQVTVFIDYQNTHQTSHETYMPYGAEVHESLLDPLLLAERLTSKRAPGGVLREVRVYRGQPDPSREPVLASYNDKQFDAWKSDPRVMIRRRTLRYPSDWGEPTCREKAREKAEMSSWPSILFGWR